MVFQSLLSTLLLQKTHTYFCLSGLQKVANLIIYRWCRETVIGLFPNICWQVHGCGPICRRCHSLKTTWVAIAVARTVDMLPFPGNPKSHDQEDNAQRKRCSYWDFCLLVWSSRFRTIFAFWVWLQFRLGLTSIWHGLNFWFSQALSQSQPRYHLLLFWVQFSILVQVWSKFVWFWFKNWVKSIGVHIGLVLHFKAGLVQWFNFTEIS